MKPCPEYRRLVVLQAAGATAPAESEQVDRHLQGCLACQRYASEIATVSGRIREHASFQEFSPPSEEFWRAWREAIVSAPLARAGVSHEWPGLRAISSLRRLAPLTAALAMGLILLFALVRDGPEPEPAPPELARAPTLSAPTRSAPHRPRTLGEYRQVANSSFDALDQLLANQARIASPGESYRVSGPR